MGVESLSALVVFLPAMKVHATVAALLVSFVVGSCSPQNRTAGGKPMRPVTPSPTEPTGGLPVKTDSPGIGTVPTPPDSPAPTEGPPRKENAAPSKGKQEAAPALDVASLEKRLRETKAIGFFTKLSLKNQMDDLRERFRAFHEARSGATLAELREGYELLLLKVLSLLQDSDPRLARDISASREVLWSLRGGLAADALSLARSLTSVWSPPVPNRPDPPAAAAPELDAAVIRAVSGR